MIHITLKEMLEEIVQCILEQKEIKDYYWKDGEGEFRRITEIDLLDRIRTSNDDFTEFEWELEESRLYKVQYGRRSLMTNEQREAIEMLKYIKETNTLIGFNIADRDKIADTVLSLIKEQQAEMEDLKNKSVLIKRYFKKCDLIKQKDKQIDLMAELVYKRFKAELLLEYGFENEEQLKQYFADLVEKE